MPKTADKAHTVFYFSGNKEKDQMSQGVALIKLF